MIDIILNQWTRSNCGVFATMAILLHMWVIIDVAKLSEIKEVFTPRIESRFIEMGLIKEFIRLPTPKLVDFWLNKWEYILASTSRWDFTLEDNEGNNLEFDWKSQHFFVIIKSEWDRWKCQNSWGAEWNWDGCFYMKKSEFKYLLTPRRIVWVQKS